MSQKRINEFLIKNNEDGNSDITLSKIEWRRVRLGDIVIFKNGINFNSKQKGNKGILTIDVKNMYTDDIYPDTDKLYRVNIDYKGDYVLKNGDILFVRSSVKKEGVAWTTTFKEIKEPVTFCGFITRAKLKLNNILPEYITYFFRSSIARDNLIDSSSQSVITNINQNSLSNVLVPLPFSNGQPDLELQQKIVQLIEELFKKISEMRGLSNKNEINGKKILLSTISKIFNDLKEKEYAIYILDDIAKTTTGGTPRRGIEDYWLDGIIPWVKSGELEDNVIFNTEERITQKGLDESNAKIFPKGSLLIALYGATVGKMATLGIDACTNQAICVIFPKDNFNRDFIKYYLYYIREMLIQRSKNLGGAQPNISQKLIRSIKIPIPMTNGFPNVKKQKQIVEQLDYISKRQDLFLDYIANSKISFEKLKQSILHKAFKGELVIEA